MLVRAILSVVKKPLMRALCSDGVLTVEPFDSLTITACANFLIPRRWGHRRYRRTDSQTSLQSAK